MKRLITILIPLLALLLVASMVFAQRGRSRDLSFDRGGTPTWENDPEFASDVFTFVRIRYSSMGGYGWGGNRWRIDWPDAELNFSWRLQQLTSLKVEPNPIVLDLTDPRLPNYPFIYIVEPGLLRFSEPEVLALRNYLFNGGFLMVDDFWGEAEYANFYREIKRVFPDREPEELPIEHPIFNIAIPLKEKPQVPHMEFAMRMRGTGITWERPDAQTPHFKGIHDDQGRMMVIICHNTDLADGWEREGADEWYFREFSEKKAYPMGINIVVYALTH
jgi:hypothetical protein